MIVPHDPVIATWFAAYVSKARASRKNFDNFLNNSLKAWVNYQGQKMLGRAAPPDMTGLNFAKWKSVPNLNNFIFELSNSADGVLRMNKVVHILNTVELSNGHANDKDAPKKIGKVLLNEDSSAPERIMLPFQ